LSADYAKKSPALATGLKEANLLRN